MADTPTGPRTAPFWVAKKGARRRPPQRKRGTARWHVWMPVHVRGAASRVGASARPHGGVAAPELQRGPQLQRQVLCAQRDERHHDTVGGDAAAGPAGAGTPAAHCGHAVGAGAGVPRVRRRRLAAQLQPLMRCHARHIVRRARHQRRAVGPRARAQIHRLRHYTGTPKNGCGVHAAGSSERRQTQSARPARSCGAVPTARPGVCTCVGSNACAAGDARMARRAASRCGTGSGRCGAAGSRTASSDLATAVTSCLHHSTAWATRCVNGRGCAKREHGHARLGTPQRVEAHGGAHLVLHGEPDVGHAGGERGEGTVVRHNGGNVHQVRGHQHVAVAAGDRNYGDIPQALVVRPGVRVELVPPKLVGGGVDPADRRTASRRVASRRGRR